MFSFPIILFLFMCYYAMDIIVHPKEMAKEKPRWQFVHNTVIAVWFVFIVTTVILLILYSCDVIWQDWTLWTSVCLLGSSTIAMIICFIDNSKRIEKEKEKINEERKYWGPKEWHELYLNNCDDETLENVLREGKYYDRILEKKYGKIKYPERAKKYMENEEHESSY